MPQPVTHVDENGNEVSADLVDENGNPVAPTSAAITSRGALVDANGMPLTHGSVAETARARLAAAGTSAEEQKAGRGRQTVSTDFLPDAQSFKTRLASSSTDAVTGVADALGGLLGLATDISTKPMRGVISGVKGARAAALTLIRGGSIEDASKAGMAAEQHDELPVTNLAARASEDFRSTARRALNLTDTSESAAGPLVRAVATMATPVPGPKIRGAAKVAEEAAPVAERAVAPALTAEEIALADRAGAAQAAAATAPERVAVAERTAAVDRLAGKPPQRPVAAPDLPPGADAGAVPEVATAPQLSQRAALKQLDDAVESARAESLAATQQARDRLSRVAVTQNGQRPRNAVTVEGEQVEFMSPKAAQALEDSITGPARQRLAEATNAREEFYRSLVPEEGAAPPVKQAAATPLDEERLRATADVYRKHISELDEIDAPVGERYRVDELFDRNSDPQSLAAGTDIYDGFQRYRDLLREKHGDTIRLVRYEPVNEPRLEGKTVTHWWEPGQPDESAYAAVDGGQRTRVERDVPIDDIVAAPAAQGGRSEFLVLNRESPLLADPTIPGGIPPPPTRGNRGGGGTSGGGEPPPTPQSNHANPLPGPHEVIGAMKRTFAPVKEWMDGIAPAAASEEAGQSASIIRNAKASIENASSLERFENRANVQHFEKIGDNTSNISEYERTGQFADAPPGYDEKFRESMEWAHSTLQDVYGENRVGYVENYVRRAFKFGTAADEAKANSILTNNVGSLSANTSPLKARVLDMPLDEALATMRAAGIDVKPVTTNPELLRQWSVENARQAQAYKIAWDEAKAQKLIQFVRQGERVPNGLVRLNDRVAEVFYPSEAGMVRAGQYYADPNVARIFNNTISKGLGGSPTFRGLRAINNAYNQFQLGFSAFHLTGTAINAGISDLALGLDRLGGGDVGGAAAAIGRSLIPVASFVRDMVHGRQFIADLMAGDADAARILVERLNPSGGRLAIDQAYRNAAVAKMKDAWANKQFIRAGINVPLAFVETIAKPLMEYAIPRVKVGAFLDLAETRLARLGEDASPAMRQHALEVAWDSIDNRFGQIVHDNLFWNRTARDLAQISTRSVGWNLGTVRELGGGMADLLRGNVSSPRTLYALSLPIYAGMIGAIYQYMHTGQLPTENRDYFYPKNGLTDNRGRPDRSSLPTYMKDVYAYGTADYLAAPADLAKGNAEEALNDVGQGVQKTATTIQHKASPLLGMMADLATNRDYFGDMIRNNQDPAAQQLFQSGKYVLGQFRPLALQQAQQSLREKSDIERTAEPFFGFTKSPAEMRMSEDEAASQRARIQQRNAREMEKAKQRHGGK